MALNKQYLCPREKFLKNGVENLTDDELIALILDTGTKKENVVSLSKRIIYEKGNLFNLFSLSYNELIKIEGIKNVKAIRLMVIKEISRRLLLQETVKEKIVDSLQCFNIAKPYFEKNDREKLVVMFLNNKNEFISITKINNGSEDNVSIPSEEILRLCISVSAKYLILFHNHPSGNCFPSEADKQSTYSLMSSAKILGIQLYDHIIITSTNYFSFKDNDILYPKFKNFSLNNLQN